MCKLAAFLYVYRSTSINSVLALLMMRDLALSFARKYNENPLYRVTRT